MLIEPLTYFFDLLELFHSQFNCGVIDDRKEVQYTDLEILANLLKELLITDIFYSVFDYYAFFKQSSGFLNNCIVISSPFVSLSRLKALAIARREYFDSWVPCNVGSRCQSFIDGRIYLAQAESVI